MSGRAQKAINLSILDFKFRNHFCAWICERTINLSILDFKFSGELSLINIRYSINLSILDFKYKKKDVYLDFFFYKSIHIGF